MRKFLLLFTLTWATISFSQTILLIDEDFNGTDIPEG